MGRVATYNVHQAKTQFSKLLDQVLTGEKVVITRYGKPIAELVAVKRDMSHLLGCGIGDPNVNMDVLKGDEWWQPMTDEQADEFFRRPRPYRLATERSSPE